MITAKHLLSLSLGTMFHFDLDACMGYDRHSMCLSALRTTAHISIKTKTAKGGMHTNTLAYH